MFTLRQASVKMAVLLHKQAKVPFVLSLAVHTIVKQLSKVAVPRRLWVRIPDASKKVNGLLFRL